MNAPRVTRLWRALMTAMRRIAGVPDYDAYVAHLRSHHPERAVPNATDFFAERLEARYRAGGGRCC